MKEKLLRWLKELPQRYKDIPKQMHSRSAAERSKAQKLVIATLCIPLMLACAAYILHWQLEKTGIEQSNEQYSALYQQNAQPSLEASAPAAMTEAPVEASAESIIASPAPTVIASETPSIAPSETPPEAKPTPRTTFEPAVDATRMPAPSPDADTIVYAVETPPPVQESFAALLKMNPETVGFLTIGERISLPVVQRKNDNDFYLNHSFEGKASDAGALFLDGSNLLVPEDAALIIYGHNMRNGTMFQPLVHYEEIKFLKEHPLVQFDTIYENRSYIPFAAFTATLEPYSEHYLDVRQFSFSEGSFERYIERINELSLYESPVDVRYGDSVLMLVTCEYLHDNGRFIVALREIRPDETIEQATGLVQQTKLKYGK